MQEPYPATGLRNFLCYDLKQKGWRAKVGCSEADEWWKFPGTVNGTTITSYRWAASLVSQEGDLVDCLFDYGAENGENYLQMLHVRAVYNVSKVRPQLQASSPPQVARSDGKATVGVEAAPSKLDFGAVKLTSISPSRVLTYTFHERAAVQDIRVETDGEEQLDFADAETGSCRGARSIKLEMHAL